MSCCSTLSGTVRQRSRSVFLLLVLAVLIPLCLQGRPSKPAFRFGKAPEQPPRTAHLVVLATSDVHGELLPYDEIA
ncbi:MAG TPA: hypothetical protein PKO06_06045, partial [Candidatus Ozemobacteraceae bacterium]|nr:hypothetical protein [Candidatus Ozemobacteraceae bacterium]